MTRFRFAAIIVSALLAGLGGCMGAKEMPAAKTYPVKGTVMIGNHPLPGGRLTLYIMDTSKYGPAEATADVQADGTFNPSAIGGSEGLMPGKWKVVVSGTGYKEGKPYRVKESIPAKYTKEETTDLVIEVKEGDNNPMVTIRQ